jgi:hypothetical protein
MDIKIKFAISSVSKILFHNGKKKIYDTDTQTKMEISVLRERGYTQQ